MEEIITKDGMQELDACIEKNKQIPGPLMPTLQDAQRIFGCVPLEVQEHIARSLNVSYAKVNGIISFYAMFTTEPKGKNVVSVCTGTACYVKGAQKLLEKVCEELNVSYNQTTPDGQFSIVATRCVGACGLAPVVTVNEDVHGNLSASDIPKIIKQYE